MKKEIAKIWTKALKSGDYKQGRFALRDNKDCFCCLGVLCDLYNKDRKEKKKKSIKILGPEYDGNKNLTVFQYGKQKDFLPIAVRKWAGMSSNKGWVNGVNLSDLNDGRLNKPYNFKEIAKFIEEHSENL